MKFRPTPQSLFWALWSVCWYVCLFLYQPYNFYYNDYTTCTIVWEKRLTYYSFRFLWIFYFSIYISAYVYQAFPKKSNYWNCIEFAYRLLWGERTSLYYVAVRWSASCIQNVFPCRGPLSFYYYLEILFSFIAVVSVYLGIFNYVF